MISLADVPQYGDPYWDQKPTDPGGPVGQHIANTFWPIFWISVVVFFGVALAIVYAALRFRRQADDEEPAQVHGNNRLEVAWTLTPFAILVSLFGLTTYNMGFIRNFDQPGALHVCVQGQRFYWSYYYEKGCGDAKLTAKEGRDYTPAKNRGVVEVISAQPDFPPLVVPTGRPVTLEVVAADVNHSFYIPELAGQVNAIPGQKNQLWFQVDNPGIYHGACTELCGSNHANMLVTIRALPPDQYAQWCQQESSKAAKSAGGNPTSNGGCQ